MANKLTQKQKNRLRFNLSVAVSNAILWLFEDGKINKKQMEAIYLGIITLGKPDISQEEKTKAAHAMIDADFPLLPPGMGEFVSTVADILNESGVLDEEQEEDEQSKQTN